MGDNNALSTSTLFHCHNSSGNDRRFLAELFRQYRRHSFGIPCALNYSDRLGHTCCISELGYTFPAHYSASNCWLDKFNSLAVVSRVGGLVMIANVSAARYAEGGLYNNLVGPIFGYATIPAFVAYLVLFTQALRHRRRVHLHSGYMLGTVFFLWEPAAARLLIGFFPPMAINGPADFHKVADAIVLGIVLPLLFAIYLYLHNRKVGMPFLVVAVFLAVQIGGVYWIADTEVWRQIFGWYAKLPATITVGSGVLLGTLAAWYGWKYPLCHSE